MSAPEIELPDPNELQEHLASTFTKRVALTTAIFAVLLAVTSLGGNNAMKEMLLAQQQASDQWAFFQAKVMREHFYSGQKQRLELDLLERSETLRPEIKKKYETLLQEKAKQEERYRGEKKEIEKEARKFEHERDVNRAKDPYFDYAEVLLQIAIVMSSIAIIAGSRPIFYFALTSACLGTLLSVNGFLLVCRLPFFHH